MHNINTLNIDYDIIFTFNKKRRKKNLSMDYSFFLTNLNKYLRFKRILHSTNQNNILIRDPVIELFVQSIDIHSSTQGRLFDSVTSFQFV